jgi:hypothetical protein
MVLIVNRQHFRSLGHEHYRMLRVCCFPHFQSSLESLYSALHLSASDLGKLQDLQHQIELANDVVCASHHEKKIVLPDSAQQGVNGYTILIQAL